MEYEDEEEVFDNFEIGFANYLQDICHINVISFLPMEYAHRVSKLKELD